MEIELKHMQQIIRTLQSIKELDQDELFDRQIQEKYFEIQDVIKEILTPYQILLDECYEPLQILNGEYQSGWEDLIELVRQHKYIKE